MANSARSRSLSAWTSAIDSGMVASNRRMVSRAARPWTRGATTSTLRAARRNPIPKYMDDLIMNTAFNFSTGRPVPASQPTFSEANGVYK